MRILQEIEQRYPTTIQLAFVNHIRSFHLSIEPSAESIRAKLKEAMEYMALRSSDQGYDAEIILSCLPDYCIQMTIKSERYEDNSTFFFGADQYRAIAVVIYGYAAQKKWLSSLNGRQVSMEVFSAKQQTYLAALSAVLHSWIEDTPNPYPMIKQSAEKAAAVFSANAPLLSKRPVERNIWNMLQDTCGGLMQKSDSTRFRSLIRNWYSEREYRQELRDYVHVLRETSGEYREFLERETENICRQLYAQPVGNLWQRLLTDGDNLIREIRELPVPERGAVRDKEEGFVKYRAVTPELIEAELHEDQKLCRALAYHELLLSYTEDLLAALTTRLKPETDRANNLIRNYLWEIDPLCRVSNSVSEFSLSWNTLESFPAIYVDRNWTSAMLFDIYTKAPSDGHLYKFWLADGQTYDELSEIVFSNIEKVDGLGTESIILIEARAR